MSIADLTAQDAAALIGVSAATLRRWTRAGKLPSVRLSPGVVRYRRADIEALCDRAVTWSDKRPRQLKPAPVVARPSWLDPTRPNPVAGGFYGSTENERDSARTQKRA